MRLSVSSQPASGGSRLSIRYSSPIPIEVHQELSRIVFLFDNLSVELERDPSLRDDRSLRSVELEKGSSTCQLVIELADSSFKPRISHLASQGAYLIDINQWKDSGAPNEDALQSSSMRWRQITIDAGHGGIDRGVLIGQNVFEKDVTLSIARRLRWALTTRLGLNVVLSRNEDQNLSLQDRAIAANEARSSLFLSLHIGSSGSAGRSYAYVTQMDGAGLSPQIENSGPLAGLFVPWEEVQSKYLDRSRQLAQMLQSEMNRSINGGDQSIKPRSARIKVLKNLAMPGVLVEIGSVEAREFQTKIVSPEFQNLVAGVLATTVEKFRGIDDRP